jgi:hypothetical protein
MQWNFIAAATIRFSLPMILHSFFFSLHHQPRYCLFFKIMWIEKTALFFIIESQIARLIINNNNNIILLSFSLLLCSALSLLLL